MQLVIPIINNMNSDFHKVNFHEYLLTAIKKPSLSWVVCKVVVLFTFNFYAFNG